MSFLSSPQDDLITIADFNPIIHPFLLRFKDSDLESLYYQKLVDPLHLSRVFRLLFFILAFILVARRVETLLFALFNIKGEAHLVINEALNVGLMVGAFALEGLFIYVKQVSHFRGFWFMTYIFFSISFSSYIDELDNLHIESAGIPAYMCGFVIGNTYAYYWIVPCISCTLGFVFKVVFNSFCSSPWCISFFSILQNTKKKTHII